MRHVYSRVQLSDEVGCTALVPLDPPPTFPHGGKPRPCGERWPQDDQWEETSDLADGERRPNGMVDGRRRWYILPLANVRDGVTRTNLEPSPSSSSFPLRQLSSSEFSPVNPPFWPVSPLFPLYLLATPFSSTVGARAKRSGSAASTRVCVRDGTTAKPARHSGLRSQ